MRLVLRLPVHSWRWAILARGSAVVLLAILLLATRWTVKLFAGFENRVVQYALAFIVVQVALLILLSAGLTIGKLISVHLEKVHLAWQRLIEQLLTDALLFGRSREALLAECAKHPDQAAPCGPGGRRQSER